MAATATALFTGIGRVGCPVLLPVISIGSGLCLRRRHTQGKQVLPCRPEMGGGSWGAACGLILCGSVDVGGQLGRVGQAWILAVHWVFGLWVEAPPEGTLMARYVRICVPHVRVLL